MRHTNRLIFTCVCFFYVLSPYHLTGKPVQPEIPFFEGSVKEIQLQARISNKPILAYFYKNACEACDALDRNTWNIPQLVDFVSHNYLAYKKNLFTSEGRQLGRQLGIFAPATVVILSPEGEVLEKITGSIEAETLIHVLKNHLQAFNPPPVLSASQDMSEAVVMAPETSSLEEDWSAQIHQEPVTASPTYRTAAQAVCRPLKHFEQYSPWQVDRFKGKVNFSIVFGKYTRIRHLKKDLKDIKKVWRNGIWVYEEYDPALKRTTYILLIGNFYDDDKADYFARFFGRPGGPRKEIIDLQAILR